MLLAEAKKVGSKVKPLPPYYKFELLKKEIHPESLGITVTDVYWECPMKTLCDLTVKRTFLDDQIVSEVMRLWLNMDDLLKPGVWLEFIFKLGTVTHSNTF